MKLEDIGFYTLSDKRVMDLSYTSDMQRCEIILTDRYNFNCKYCRGLRNDCKGDMSLSKVDFVLNEWFKDNLKNIRFSGGEPTLYSDLNYLVERCKKHKVEHIAISTNGSMKQKVYDKLLLSGVNDFSISLDACCASFADGMAGTNSNFDQIISNIVYLSKRTYVSIGVVLTEDNVSETKKIVEFVDTLGVSDIRIISAAQYNQLFSGVVDISEEILNKYPILKYRVNNIKNGINVRGLKVTDCHTCYLSYDDSVVSGNYHFPCVIYMREHGEPIGVVSNTMREERIEWSKNHNSFNDPICKKNCLDVCILHNNRVSELRNDSIF